MHCLYNIGIWIFGFIIYIAAFFNPKAKQWVKGRKNILEKLEPADYWFHCASLGEFEQGRPIIEAIKKQTPDKKILLSFFSPSGYEVRKNYHLADQVCYLPLDSPKNAKTFIKNVNPETAIFIKYEFWYNYLIQLDKKGVKSYVASSIFRKEQLFFKWYGVWFKNILKTINHFFVQNQESKDLLASIDIKESSISGDTRFDQVIQHVKQVKSIPLIEAFKGNQQLIVCGSTWPKDEELILKTALKYTNLKWLIAPHNIKNSKNLAIQSKGILYSEATTDSIKKHSILIIDNIGMLSNIYQYANVSYIGGGFDSGIHNILEAAAFGCPTLFGPKHHKFKEAIDLIKLGGSKSIYNTKTLRNELEYFLTNDKNVMIKEYCKTQSGATSLITQKICHNHA
tara:strand:+ start:1173 stop:2363 length:1191 start_codon:yes stop_codon:yes gene_type:complete